MGIARGAARLLLKEASVNPFTGSVLQLGRQDIHFNRRDFEHWADLHNVSVAGTEFQISNKGDRTDTGNTGDIDDVRFFQLLGFSLVQSLDKSDYENADIILDLNLPVSREFHEKFDVIFDGGTMEHCFNTPQLLQNLFSMLKIGGRVIHLSPTSNMVDHGFYMFSPTLFWDYYRGNNWEVKAANLIELTQNSDVDPWLVYEYTPSCLRELSVGGFRNGKILDTWFICQKLKHSTGSVFPQQGSYIEEWTRSKSNEGVERKATSAASANKLLQMHHAIKRRLRNSPLLFSVTRFISYPYLRYKNRKSYKMPPLVGKY